MRRKVKLKRDLAYTYVVQMLKKSTGLNKNQIYKRHGKQIANRINQLKQNGSIVSAETLDSVVVFIKLTK